MSEAGIQDDWIRYTEGRRRGVVLRGVGILFVVLAAAFRASHREAVSSADTLLVVGAACLLAVAVIVGFFVRPKLTPQGTAFFVLTPVGAVSRDTLVVTNPNATFPGRIVVASTHVQWTSKRGGHLSWQRSEVANVSVRRVASFRPLGYLAITMVEGASFTARIFQPREIAAALRACGYPT